MIRLRVNVIDKILVLCPKIVVDFTPPWKRIPMLEGLKEYAGIDIPLPLEGKGMCLSISQIQLFDSHARIFSHQILEARDYLDAELVKREIKCSAPRSTARMIDKLVI